MADDSQHWFVTTRWSIVLAAGCADPTKALAALEELCRAYWYPLYAFVRRLGHKPQDAEDLVQAFFAQCISKNYLTAADRNRGRFRSFLLVALKRFLANEWDKARTQKRGGRHQFVSLDDLEDKYALEPAGSISPEKLYERRWALTLLEKVLARLEGEQDAGGRPGLFAYLKPLLTSDRTSSRYSDIANDLGMTEAAVKVAVHRLRLRYRKLLEEEIAHTVTSPEEIEEERRYLFQVIAGG